MVAEESICSWVNHAEVFTIGDIPRTEKGRCATMANNELVNSLVEKSGEVYSRLTSTKDYTLSRQQILETIGEELQPYYTNLVQGLADLKLVVRNRGYYGGISLAATEDEHPAELTAEHRDRLHALFSEIDLKPTTKIKKAANEEEDEKLEKQFYDPLKDYLEKSGLYELVVVNPKTSGSKWENADIATVSFERELRFHSNIDLRVTAIEVKRHFPSAEHVQQAASYLVYAHASYLCYFDSQFRGTNIDTAIQRLRDEGIWDLAETFGIGLIVAYYAQETGTKLHFQTVRHVPYRNSAPAQAERGIDLWLDETAKKTIKRVYVKHVQRLLSGLD